MAVRGVRGAAEVHLDPGPDLLQLCPGKKRLGGVSLDSLDIHRGAMEKPEGRGGEGTSEEQRKERGVGKALLL